MPPPTVAKVEARLNAQKIGGARRSTSPNKDKNRVQKPTPKPSPRIDFSKFPAEIQQMIWTEAIQKPACHTFKLVFSQISRMNQTWEMDLHVHQINHDHSAYRQWKAMLWNGEYKLPDPSGITTPWQLDDDAQYRHAIEKSSLDQPRKPMVLKSQKAVSKLANASFQAGFRRAMIDFQLIRAFTPNGGGWREAAAIDVATDLTILEFERGVNAPALHWFEHSTGRLLIDTVRSRMKQLKRVAVQYKKSHKYAYSRGPFQCYCPSGSELDCSWYKACPVEQACFLDCFPDLKEFYYVVEVTRIKELAWKRKYKGQFYHVSRQGYKVKTSNDPASAPFELHRFYDMKYEYIQLCPEPFFQFLPYKLRLSQAIPLEATVEGGARECLINVMDIYKGKIGSETFKNSVEERKKVKFGILFAYEIEK